MNKLQYDEHGLASKQLIEYLINIHDLNSSVFSILTLEKIIEYGEANCDVSKDQLAYYLVDLIPELTYEEVILFFSDEKLTEFGLEEKTRRLQALEVFTV